MRITLELDLSLIEECREALRTLSALVETHAAAKAPAVTAPLVTPVPPTAKAVPVSDKPLWGDTSPNMGTNARLVVETIVSLANAHGETTLEQVASTLGSSVPTVRAHLMNAARSLRNAGQSEPYTAVWHPERQCVIYTSHA
jgi:hypothetical protein